MLVRDGKAAAYPQEHNVLRTGIYHNSSADRYQHCYCKRYRNDDSPNQAFVQAGESQWTFGRTLAIFMLMLPLKDIFLGFLGEDKQLSQTRERIDKERDVYRRNHKK
jgi:hypothetical protein